MSFFFTSFIVNILLHSKVNNILTNLICPNSVSYYQRGGSLGLLTIADCMRPEDDPGVQCSASPHITSKMQNCEAQQAPTNTTPTLECSVLAKRIQVVALHLGKASSGGKLLARSGGIQQSEKTVYMLSDMLLDLLLLLLFISGGTADIFSVPVRIIANPTYIAYQGVQGMVRAYLKNQYFNPKHFLSSKRGAFP